MGTGLQPLFSLNLSEILKIGVTVMKAYAHPEAVVDTDWLQAHLTDPLVKIVEVEMSPEVNAQKHLPGATFWHIFRDLLLLDFSQNLDPMSMAALLSRSGITPATTVVAYGSYPGTGGWIFWLLHALGHENVAVLNGGQAKWLAEGRACSAELADPTPSFYPEMELNTAVRVLQPEVAAALHQPGYGILDVRTAAEYRGEVFLNKPPVEGERGGHIPGAVHLEHGLTVNEDGTFKSVEELQELFQSKGIRPDLVVYPYCAIGGRSAYMWFVLKYLLGYPQVRNYDGSWHQWSRLSNTPIES
jgi:thiosulfate/3-mercaptopyruvate sulfurtransferase